MVKRAITLGSQAAWFTGDCALEIAPMNDDHGRTGAEEALRQFADEIGTAFETVRGLRTVAAAWPKDTRRADMSWSAHRVLMGRQELARPGITARQAAAELAQVRAAEAVAGVTRLRAVTAADSPPPPAPPPVPANEGSVVMLTIPRCSLCTGTAVIAATVFGSPACLCRACAGRTEHTSPLLLEAAGAAAELPTPEEAAEFLAAQEWTSARTMPQWPHEYVMARKSADTWMALRVIEFIRATGERRRWHSEWFWYWAPEGSEYEYWAMNPGETVINRRRLDWDDNSG
jgi:hypothetical protein